MAQETDKLTQAEALTTVSSAAYPPIELYDEARIAEFAQDEEAIGMLLDRAGVNHNQAVKPPFCAWQKR